MEPTASPCSEENQSTNSMVEDDSSESKTSSSLTNANDSSNTKLSCSLSVESGSSNVKHNDNNLSIAKDDASVIKDSVSVSSYGEPELRHATTNAETMFHIFKGNVGTGILAMPEAFYHAGLWLGFIAMPIIGATCIHCMHLLLRSSKRLCSQENVGRLNYETTAEFAFKNGPKNLRKFKNFIRKIIIVFLVITQMGFCCVYVVFVAQNIYQVIVCSSSKSSEDIKLTELSLKAIILLPLMIVCFISELKFLAIISMIATALQSMGLVIIIYYCVKDLPYIHQEPVAVAGWSTLPLFFGSALFAIEGIGLVLPLENKMKNPQDFGGYTGVLNTAMSFVVCLYVTIGFFGYLQFGDEVQGSITLNLPSDELLAQSTKILLAIAIFFSYPLQMYVPVRILQPMVESWFHSKRTKAIGDYGLRVTLVLITFIFAAAIPNIGLFISLVGASSGATLALIIPPIVDTITFWPRTGRFHWIIIKNLAISIFGFLGLITGTYTSILGIIDDYKSEDNVFVCN